MAIREQRARTLQAEDVDFDTLVAADVSTSEERAVAFDRVTRAAEALRGCKRDEVAAMILKADGHSYDEICSVTGWTYTKVNRCLTEGRSRFLARYAAIEAGEECQRLAPLLSLIVDGEATPVQMAEARPHLRNCAACRASLRELSESQAAIHAVLPAAAVLGVSGLADGAAGLFARTYELVVGGVHDRLALTALKAHQAMETVSATKAAAVAASAAAVAGGGAVALEQARTPAPAAAKRMVTRQPPAPPRPAVTAAPPERRAVRAARSAPSVKAKPRVRKVARVASAATPVPPSPPRREFGFETAEPAAPVTAAPRAAKTEDFGFER